MALPLQNCCVQWDSNHLPHDSLSDVLPTKLRMGCNYLTGKMIYKEYGDHRRCARHALVFLFSC